MKLSLILFGLLIFTNYAVSVKDYTVKLNLQMFNERVRDSRELWVIMFCKDFEGNGRPMVKLWQKFAEHYYSKPYIHIAIVDMYFKYIFTIPQK